MNKSTVISPLKAVLSIIILSFAYSAIGPPLSAQNTLDYYLGNAQAHNPAIVENNNLILKSQLDRKLTEASYNKPQINLTANYWFTPYLNNGSQIVSANPDDKAIGYDPSLTNGGLYSAQLNLSKSLLTDVFTSAYNEQSDIAEKNAGYANELLKHALVRDVTDAYLTACQDQLINTLQKAVADTVLVQLAYLEELVKKGFAKKSDYLLLQIESDNQKLAVEQSWSDFLRDRNALFTLCGIHDTSTGSLLLPELARTEIPVSSHFMSRYTLDSSGIENQQRIFETRYAPQLSAFVNTGLNSTTLDGIQRRFGLSAGLNFSLPLYDGDQKTLTRQQSDVLLKTVKEYRDNQYLQISNNRSAAAVKAEIAKKNYEHIEVQIKNYEQVLRLATDEVRSGQRSYIDYINVIRSYIDLKKSEAAAIIGYQSAINQSNYWNW